MKKTIWTFAVFALSTLCLTNAAKATTIAASYDADSATAPTLQGWSSYTSGQATGSVVLDNGRHAWKAQGQSGRAQWTISPDATTNAVAKTQGWKLEWTSRILSGGYITDYYANGSLRFVPILSINTDGDLIAELSGGDTYTLIADNGAADYHHYEVIYNPDTGNAVFKFDGAVITSNWQGESTSQNLIAFGNGSSGIDGVAYYRSASLTVTDNDALVPVIEWDTSDISFDGSSEYLSIDSDLSVISGLTEGSIFTSFRATGTTATIFSASSSTEASSEFALVVNGDGSLRVHAREDGSFTNDTQTIGSYNDNQLHHAVVTVGSKGTKIFVDGALVQVGASTSFINAVNGLNKMHIGRNLDSGGGQWYFNGKINKTKVFSTAISDSDAVRLSRSANVIASFQAQDDLTPADLGWLQDYTGAASGSVVIENGVAAWRTMGNGGRAEWEIKPSSEVNGRASQRGWRVRSVVRVESGGAMSSYYANGQRRFLVQLSINSAGDLIAELENGGVYNLVPGTGAEHYHNIDITYDPSTSQATFYFDSVAIETWSGATTTQNVIVWGNGSSSIDGTASFRSASFEVLENGAAFFESVVFEGRQEGAGGSNNYRIPSIIEAPNGALLAFIEGRPNGGDPGVPGIINISLKRSLDKGRTWLPVQVLESNVGYDYSDPRPLVDEVTGEVYVFYSQWLDLCAQNNDCIEPEDPNYLLYKKSSDDGATWSEVVNISDQVKDPSWRSINAGPGHGIQLKWQSSAQGSNTGRLILPAIVRNSASAFYVVSIYSDDNGASWHRGTVTPTSGATEADIVELTDGRLLMTARNDGGASVSRFHFLSNDGGQTWTQTSHNLVVSRVDVGITRFSAVRSGDAQDRILVSAPIGEPAGSNRNNLGIWSSYDEGVSFEAPQQLVYGFSAYSDIITLSDGTVGIIYEATGSTLIKFINIDLTATE